MKKVKLSLIIVLLASFIMPLEAFNLNSVNKIEDIFKKSPQLGSIEVENIQSSINILDDIYNDIMYIEVLDKHGKVINEELLLVKSYYNDSKEDTVEAIFTRISQVQNNNAPKARSVDSLSGDITIFMYYTGVYAGHIVATVSAENVDGVFSTYGKISAYPVKQAKYQHYKFMLGEKTIPWLHKLSPITYRFTAQPYFLDGTFKHIPWDYESVTTFDVVVR